MLCFELVGKRRGAILNGVGTGMRICTARLAGLNPPELFCTFPTVVQILGAVLRISNHEYWIDIEQSVGSQVIRREEMG